MRIKATGYKDGTRLTVEVTGDEAVEYKFDGRTSYVLQAELEDLIDSGVLIGGTYPPQTQGLKILAALQEDFFDGAPEEVEATGIEEEIPTPNGEDAIY